ncbi:MAG: phosphopentomutase [Candidatus Meridianibacter frigidus]|nr:MAG: phosphopentomutase [Candidatus Eremiobacteraeota bacterium]
MGRFVTIVLDSAGVGALPDASDYQDGPAANTLGNVARRVGGLALPNFGRYGLGNVVQLSGVPPAASPRARIGRLRERSKGKDTITGHWEMTGIITQTPFPTYPHGFPAEVLARFAAVTGKEALGNVAASGTQIIEEFGPLHITTGRPILYTSADSVFQIAAHEDVVPLATLYDWCERARELLVPPHNVNRVIARPFVGSPGAFARTANRRDYATEPPPGMLDRLAACGVPVHAVGKICDIFCGHGVASSVRVQDNRDAMERTFELLAGTSEGFIFVNLNDFDSKYGHRRDVRGYAQALEDLDALLPQLEGLLRSTDEVIFTADHGCDPTAPGSDHTREYVPFIHLGPVRGENLGIIEGLDYVGRTVEASFNLQEKAI